MNRIAGVSKLGSAALFRASDESFFVTGTALHIDGGMVQI